MRLYYGGLAIHQSQSDDGMIEVVDLGDSRSLHFGTYPRQSTMSMTTPYSLELSYTEAMMACLIINPQPQKILIVGLGGGSLVKFLLHYFPECQIDVIEYRQDVIDVAQRYFSVPVDEARLTIHHGDGYAFVQDCAYKSEIEYDLLLVDAYDHIGMSKSIGAQAFFDACAGVLSPQGVMSINLWGSDRPLFNQSMMRINHSFSGQSLILPVDNKGNTIVLVMKRHIPLATLKKRKPQAEQQEIDYGIQMSKFLYDLLRQNRSLINRLFA